MQRLSAPSWREERGVGTGSAVIGRSEPGGQGVTKALVRAFSDPGDVSVGPNQHGRGSSDRAEHRELPHTVVSSVEALDPIRP